MASSSQQPTGRDNTLLRLNLAIDALSIAKDVSTIAPAQAAFGSVCALLTIIRVLVFLFRGDGFHTYVSLGLYCQRRGLRGVRITLRRYLQSDRSRYEREEIRRPQPVCVRGDKPTHVVGSSRDVWFWPSTNDTFDRRTVAEIQGKATRHSGRNRASRLLHAWSDKDKIAAWKLELDRILRVFNVRSVCSTWLLLTIRFPDRVGDKYPCFCFRHSRRCIKDAGRGPRSGPFGESQLHSSCRE